MGVRLFAHPLGGAWVQRRRDPAAAPESLDFWRNFDPGRDLEAGDMIERIPSPFNQLTVFDARIPHGVRMVRGTHDPLDSRVVLHGWFKYPELTASAELRDEKSLVALKLASASVAKRLEEFDSLAAIVTVRVEVGGNGGVEEARILSNTLVSTAGEIRARRGGQSISFSTRS
jgi:hypothetical protein